uniref:Uncharacterized protein n=1 Tax=Amphimedon queenslandica TaxID=400682 RepID=A0A1X7V2H9_AMPQE
MGSTSSEALVNTAKLVSNPGGFSVSESGLSGSSNGSASASCKSSFSSPACLTLLEQVKVIALTVEAAHAAAVLKNPFLSDT